MPTSWLTSVSHHSQHSTVCTAPVFCQMKYEYFKRFCFITHSCSAVDMCFFATYVSQLS